MIEDNVSRLLESHFIFISFHFFIANKCQNAFAITYD